MPSGPIHSRHGGPPQRPQILTQKAKFSDQEPIAPRYPILAQAIAPRPAVTFCDVPLTKMSSFRHP